MKCFGRELEISCHNCSTAKRKPYSMLQKDNNTQYIMFSVHQTTNTISGKRSINRNYQKFIPKTIQGWRSCYIECFTDWLHFTAQSCAIQWFGETLHIFCTVLRQKITNTFCDVCTNMRIEIMIHNGHSWQNSLENSVFLFFFFKHLFSKWITKTRLTHFSSISVTDFAVILSSIIAL